MNTGGAVLTEVYGVAGHGNSILATAVQNAVLFKPVTDQMATAVEREGNVSIREVSLC